MTFDWQNITAAPRDGRPLLLGTLSGGVLIELWHWCSEAHDYRGTYSKMTFERLRRTAPDEVFLYAIVPAPTLPGTAAGGLPQ